jgi:uracil-DNA glycosylase
VKAFDTLLAQVRACRAASMCRRLARAPIVRASAIARILIASQAPGTRVHESGIPFADASGGRLREWMNVSANEFYDESRVAIVPMALCYPGRLQGGGDAPPRSECAPPWRQQLRAHTPDLRLTLLVGIYVQDHVLGRGKMTERVKDFRDCLRRILLPHPSWHAQHWATLNPWFDAEVLPGPCGAVRAVLA